MVLFRYKALSGAGKKTAGVIEADSYEGAKERLHRQQVLVTELSAAQSKRELVLNPPLLLSFTRELSQLLQAGLPLYESLAAIEEKYRRHRCHFLFLDLCDQLKNGHSLSTALKKYPKTFDPIYISMVFAGENTGALSWAFQQLFALIERRQKLKKQLTNALAYPLFLTVFCFLVVLGLLLFVIPSMQDLFEGRTLHPLTNAVLGLSHALKHSIGVIGLTVATLSVAGVYFFKKPAIRRVLDRGIQSLPLMKTILMHAALIRFCRTTSVLLFGGVPLVAALKISRQVMHHTEMEKAVASAEHHIVEGKPLSAQLKEFSCIPPLVIRMLAIAEETGRLSEMMQNLSEIYDEELDKNLTLLTTFLQPALLIILGGVIGFVILSILLPLTDVSSFINS